jgi:DNA-binding transcriptional regulator YiaG
MEVGAKVISGGLAKRIGVSEMTIVNWEKGRTNPIKQYFKRLKIISGDFPPSD